MMILSGVFQNSFFIGMIALILSWAVSGCRVGNNTEENPEPPPLFTGYYQAELSGAQSLQYCQTDDLGTENCEFPQAGAIPQEISEVMGNPVAFQVIEESGLSILFDPFGSGVYFEVNVSSIYASSPDAGLSYSFESPTPPATVPAWEDENCTVRNRLTESGQIHRTGGPVVSGLQTVGRIDIEFFVEYLFEVVDPSKGDCAASMAGIHACYLNIADCGEDPQINLEYVQQLFEDHIQSGLITADDIPTTRSLSYRIRYQ